MRRAGPIRDIEHSPTDLDYKVAVQFNINGLTRLYSVRFDSHRRLMSFTPEPLNLSNMNQGLGYDSVTAADVRSRCIAAVDQLNQHLRWTWFGPAAVQQVGPDFIVTYVTVSPAEQKKHVYLDPLVSFLVTPNGTVFAAFFGA